MSKQPPSKLDRFAALKAKVQAKHGLRDDDDRANLLAGLLLMQEKAIERMAAGQEVDLAAFTKCMELIEKYIPRVVPKVELKIVRRRGPKLKQPDHPPKPSDAAPSTPSAAAPSDAAPPAPKLPPIAARPPTGSEFHDQCIELSNGRVARPPLRGLTPSYDVSDGPHATWWVDKDDYAFRLARQQAENGHYLPSPPRSKK